MSKITYENKVNMRTTATPRINKVVADDMNEIKNVVNANDDNVGELNNLTTDDNANIVAAINEVNKLSIAKMNTNRQQSFTSDTNVQVTGWTDVINYGDISAQTSNNRIKITNTRVLEISGATCGYGSTAIHYELKELSGSDVIGQRGKFLFQQSGSGYWAVPLPTILVRLERSKTYYLTLWASRYNNVNFNMNQGFGNNATHIMAKKLS